MPITATNIPITEAFTIVLYFSKMITVYEGKTVRITNE